VSNFYWSKSAPKNAKNDYHVARPGAGMCLVDVMLMSSAICLADVLLTSAVRIVDFEFNFLPV
jgi:hypothetical protein